MRNTVFLGVTLCLLCGAMSCTSSGPGNGTTKPSIFGSIKGTITGNDKNAPIAGAEVSLKSSVASTPDNHMYTKTDGSYEFTRLDPGLYSVTVGATGYEPVTFTLDVVRNITTNGNKVLEVIPAEIPKIYGVVKANDQPVPNAYIYLVPTYNNNTNVEVGNGTGSDGAFSFSGLPDGERYKLYVFKEGYRSLTPDREVVMPQEANVQMVAKTAKIIGFDKILMDFGETTDIAALNIDTGADRNVSWQLTSDKNWITFDSQFNDDGASQIRGEGIASVRVHVDRDYLSGKNSERVAKIVLTADGDSDEMWIIVSGTGEGINIGDVVTMAVRDVTTNSATVSCLLLDDEMIAGARQVGVCYSYENNTPEMGTGTDQAKPVDLSAIGGDGTYEVPLSGLMAGKTYYVRAYVIDKNGRVHYSTNARQFYTPTEIVRPILLLSAATNIQSYSATLNAAIVNPGSPAFSECGFCYSNMNRMPTTNNYKVPVNNPPTNYSAEISGLERNTTYYVRAYAVHGGEAIYSNDVIEFRTTWTQTVVTTASATNIGATYATFNGRIDNPGDPTYTERGFCYAEGYYTYPDITDKRVRVDVTESADFSIKVSGLEQNKPYSVVAYVIQYGEVVYGNTIDFETIFTPTAVRTMAESNVGLGHFTMNGRIDVTRSSGMINFLHR